MDRIASWRTFDMVRCSSEKIGTLKTEVPPEDRLPKERGRPERGATIIQRDDPDVKLQGRLVTALCDASRPLGLTHCKGRASPKKQAFGALGTTPLRAA